MTCMTTSWLSSSLLKYGSAVANDPLTFQADVIVANVGTMLATFSYDDPMLGSLGSGAMGLNTPTTGGSQLTIIGSNFGW